MEGLGCGTLSGVRSMRRAVMEGHDFKWLYGVSQTQKKSKEVTSLYPAKMERHMWRVRTRDFLWIKPLSHAFRGASRARLYWQHIISHRYFYLKCCLIQICFMVPIMSDLPLSESFSVCRVESCATSGPFYIITMAYHVHCSQGCSIGLNQKIHGKIVPYIQ